MLFNDDLSWLSDNPLGDDDDDTPPPRTCDYPDCSNQGEYPAPRGPESKNRMQPEDWFWFCLEHVRQYNASWDFCKDMSSEEIHKMRDRDVTWERPTWPFTQNQGKFSTKTQYQDPFNIFPESDFEGGKQQQSARHDSYSSETGKALAKLNLDYPFSMKELKKKYRELAKKYHPDHNLGDKKAEDKLKEINQAYVVLKKQLQD